MVVLKFKKWNRSYKILQELQLFLYFLSTHDECITLSDEKILRSAYFIANASVYTFVADKCCDKKR